jgi:hypothetical protein
MSPPHYTPEDWADFVRDVAPTELSNSMRQHLTAGCATCRELHDTWSRVLALCTAEELFEPPASAVLIVQKMFAASFRPAMAPGVAATLLFDSKSALLVGVRTTQPTARHLLFAAGDFLIHVHIERAKAPNSIIITGQVMEMNAWEPRVSGRRVRILSPSDTVAAVETNELGEFRVELAEARDRLSMVVEFVGTSLTIPLDGVMEMQS